MMDEDKIMLIRKIAIIVSIIGLSIILLFVGLSIINKDDDKISEEPLKEYLLVFDTQGAQKLDSLLIKEGYVTLPEGLSKDGYVFVGWMVDDELVDEEFFVEKSTRLKAKWEKESVNFYTVTFDTDGADIDIPSQLIEEGLQVEIPEAPTKDGYIFTYWEYEEDNFDFDTPITENITLKAVWTKKQAIETYYNIDFDLNGGEGSIPSQTVMEGGIVTKPHDPTKSGYIFVEWQVDNTSYNFSTLVNKNMTLVAKWKKGSSTKTTTKTTKKSNKKTTTKNKTTKTTEAEFIRAYVVTFDLNGGKGSLAKQVILKGNTASSPENLPTRSGYIFVEWQHEGKPYNFNTPITENITLKAVWKRKSGANKTYNVSFDLNGGSGSIPAQTVPEGGTVTRPADPIRSGYTFVEWQFAGSTYNFKTLVTQTMSLKAVWKKNSVAPKTYTVTFNLNGGSGSIAKQTITEGSKVDRPANPTRSGYTFIEWLYNGYSYNFNTPVTNNMTLTASWVKNSVATKTYTVTFNLNGGSGSIAKQTITEGGKVSKPANPTRSGYTFVEWLYNDSSYNFNTKVTKNMTLTASWVKNSVATKTYTVTFNLNGGSGSIAKQTITEGGKVSKPANPTRSGYTFVEWLYNGSSYNFNTKVTKSMTLTASWEKNVVTPVSYTVIFNDNYSSSSRKTVTSGSAVSKPANPTRTGYTFIGWYTSAKKEFNFNTKITSNITLYALWAPKLNYTNNSTGTWIFINNPETLSSDDLLADNNYGNTLLYKTAFNGTAELYYSHGVGSSHLNKIYYAIRIYNPHSTSVTLKINKCGAVMGWSASEIWRQYHNGSCSLTGKSYSIPAKTSVIIYQSGNSFVYGSNATQSSVAKVSSTAFEGVLNMYVSKEVQIGSLAFKDIYNTYNASYTGNITKNYLDGSNKLTPARVYSGTYNKLPMLNHYMTYEIFDQTPSGVLPISYTATNGSTYISSPVSSFATSDRNKTVWRTHLLGGSIDTSSATNYKVLYHEKQFVEDFIKLSVPITSSSSMTLGPYKTYSDSRALYHAASGNLMRGWPHNWGNWAVHYKENITIKNSSSSAKTVTFRLAELTTNQTVVVLYNNKLTGYVKNGTQNIWSVTVAAGKSVTIPVEILLGGHSNGGITRELVLN